MTIVLPVLCKEAPPLIFVSFALVAQVMIGEDKVIRLGGCKSGQACSIVLRGASSHVLDEAERSLHDALCILTATVKEPRIICGGGCTEILMAQAIDRQVESTPGKKALAMASFARALRQLPAIVADNGGYDSAELVTQLRAAHASGKSTYGLDMYNGAIGDMTELGVAESFKSKLCVLLSASEAAEMILRVDGKSVLLIELFLIKSYSQIAYMICVFNRYHQMCSQGA
jgi:T-complex protein 1 subunit beta